MSRVRHDAGAGVDGVSRFRRGVAIQPCRRRGGAAARVRLGAVDRAAGARGFVPLTAAAAVVSPSDGGVGITARTTVGAVSIKSRCEGAVLPDF